MAAEESSICIDLTVQDNNDSSTCCPQTYTQQNDKVARLQQGVPTGRHPAPQAEAHAQSQHLEAQTQSLLCASLLYMPLAKQIHAELQPSGIPAKPHIAAAEGQDCMLDHVMMMDILRVLSDSRPAEGSDPSALYGSLQVQYLQGLPDCQAFHQGRMLVYLEWLTQVLFQRGLTIKHQVLYAFTLDMCKATQVLLHGLNHQHPCCCCVCMTLYDVFAPTCCEPETDGGQMQMWVL